MKSIRTFNASGTLKITHRHITGHLAAIQTDGQAVEVVSLLDILEGGVIGVNATEERSMLINVLFTQDGKPKVGTLTVGEPQLDAGEEHIAKVVKHLVRQMEDELA